MYYDISQGCSSHGRKAYTDIYFKGTHFWGKFCEFYIVDSKNWCPWNFKGFLMTTKFNTSKIPWVFSVVFWFFDTVFFYQNQTVLNCSWTSQSNCRFVPLFLKKNWIYWSETLLGPTGHFFDDQKCQKKAERF